MSNRPCNYCQYQNLLRRAEAMGMTVTKRTSALHVWSKGVDVFMHPPEVNPDEDRDRYFKVWFAELPDHCAC